MADVAVSSQLRQWSFEKPASTRPERSDSTTSSPDLSHREPETLRIDAQVVHAAAKTALPEQSTFQERYLSSEEDLSPMDGNTTDDDYDSDVSIHEAKPSFFKARTMSISKWDKGKSCDLAVTVSYVSAGRPKVIELAQSPVSEKPPRPSSLAQLPLTAISKLRQQDQQSRRSLIVKSSVNRSVSPAISINPTPYPYAHSNKSAVLLSSSRSASSASLSLSQSPTTSRSSSPSVSEKSSSTTCTSTKKSARPASAAGLPLSRSRSSLYLNSSARHNTHNPLAPFPPLTPQSPAPNHAFLSSDPYENATTSAASPILKQSPHKRLRSISQRLSLARIAITPSKKWDSRVNGGRTASVAGGGNMPPTPSTPYTPLTPMTAPLPYTSTTTTTTTTGNKLRRNSRMMPSTSRPGTAHGARGASPEVPPMPAPSVNVSPKKGAAQLARKMVARGADEREPTIELPPCPGEEEARGKGRKIRKRKSLMDLL